MWPWERGGYFDELEDCSWTRSPRLSPLSDDEDDERDRPFNAYRFAASDNAKGIVAEAIRLLLNYEAHFKLRKNKRRPRDQETFDLTVDAILSDLMHHHLAGYPAASTSRAPIRCSARRAVPATGHSKVFPVHPRSHGEAGDGLCRTGRSHLRVRRLRRSTVIRPGSRFCRASRSIEIGLDDLDEHPHGETIILKRVKDRRTTGTKAGSSSTTTRPRQTVTGRSSTRSTSGSPRPTSGSTPEGHPMATHAIDIRDRRLRRVFTQGRFDSGGRLFGGFWQNLRKQERRRTVDQW